MSAFDSMTSRRPKLSDMTYLSMLMQRKTSPASADKTQTQTQTTSDSSWVNALSSRAKQLVRANVSFFVVLGLLVGALLLRYWWHQQQKNVQATQVAQVAQVAQLAQAQAQAQAMKPVEQFSRPGGATKDGKDGKDNNKNSQDTEGSKDNSSSSSEGGVEKVPGQVPQFVVPNQTSAANEFFNNPRASQLYFL